MRKSVFGALMFQLVTVIFCIAADFFIWRLGWYLYIAPAVIFIAVAVVGCLAFPPEKLKTMLFSTFIFLLLPCTIPQIEFSYELAKRNPEYSYQELLTDIRLDRKISAELTAKEKKPSDIPIEELADHFHFSNRRTEQPCELYKTRLYHFVLMPIFFVFLMFLILILRIFSKK